MIGARFARAGKPDIRLRVFCGAMRCEDITTHSDFRHLSSIADIAVGLRCAGSRKFAGRDLDGALDCARLHRMAAVGLDVRVE